MRTLRVVCVSVAVLGATGCLASVPLDTSPEIPVDKSLLGTWDCQGELFDTEAGTLTITAADASRLLVEVKEVDEEAERYEAYASNAAGGTMFNVKAAIGTPPFEPEWAFVRASVSGDKLRIQAPGYDDAPLAAKTSTALRALLEADARKPGFFLDLAACVRAKAKKDAPK
jgi:hypothetical protein